MLRVSKNHLSLKVFILKWSFRSRAAPYLLLNHDNPFQYIFFLKSPSPSFQVDVIASPYRRMQQLTNYINWRQWQARCVAVSRVRIAFEKSRTRRHQQNLTQLLRSDSKTAHKLKQARKKKVTAEKYKIWPWNFHRSRMCVEWRGEGESREKQTFTILWYCLIREGETRGEAKYFAKSKIMKACWIEC